MPVRSLDAAASVFFVLFGAWLIYEAWRYGIVTDTGPGSGTFPFLAGVLISLFSLLNLAKQIKGNETVKAFIRRRELVQIGAIVALIYGYTVVASWLGMFLPLPFLLVGISLCISWRTDRRWLAAIGAGSLGFSFVCYLIFDRFLNILLPKGPFGF